MILNVTENAKAQLKKVGKPNVSLAVKGGGCSGFQYEWGTTSEPPTVENLWLDPMAEMFVLVAQLIMWKSWGVHTSKY